MLILDIKLFVNIRTFCYGSTFNEFLTQKISKMKNVAENVKRATSNMKLKETLNPSIMRYYQQF